jgi:hypothetical protein
MAAFHSGAKFSFTLHTQSMRFGLGEGEGGARPRDAVGVATLVEDARRRLRWRRFRVHHHSLVSLLHAALSEHRLSTRRQPVGANVVSVAARRDSSIMCACACKHACMHEFSHNLPAMHRNACGHAHSATVETAPTKHHRGTQIAWPVQ